MEINNNVIHITGASSGIGRATALALSTYNNKIIIPARRRKLLEEVAARIRKNGSECLVFDEDATEFRQRPREQHAYRGRQNDQKLHADKL